MTIILYQTFWETKKKIENLPENVPATIHSRNRRRKSILSEDTAIDRTNRRPPILGLFGFLDLYEKFSLRHFSVTEWTSPLRVAQYIYLYTDICGSVRGCAEEKANNEEGERRIKSGWLQVAGEKKYLYIFLFLSFSSGIGRVYWLYREKERESANSSFFFPMSLKFWSTKKQSASSVSLG